MNSTFGWIEYEDVFIVGKVGDWMVEKPKDFELGENLRNGVLVMFEQSQCVQFYKSMIMNSTTAEHKQVEKQIRMVKPAGRFQSQLEGSVVNFEVYQNNFKILDCERSYSGLMEQIIRIFERFSNDSVQSVIFSEICYESSEYIQRYIELYIEAVELFTKQNKQRTIKRFTIFIRPEFKGCFLKAIEKKSSVFKCYSYIQ